MSRLVHFEPPVTASGLESIATGATAGGPKENAYLDRVSKYIPTEVVAAYLAISLLLSAVTNDDDFKLFTAWFVYGSGLLFTWLYLSKAEPESATLHGWPRKAQLLIATGAFAVWGYALGGPYKFGPVPHDGLHYREWFGGVLVILYTLFAGLYVPKKPDPPQPDPTKPDPNAGGS
jgi:hypothetical protein